MSTLFDYLKQLERNNNREWFIDHKSTFEEAKKQADDIFDEVYNELSKVEELEPLKKFRIYRDVRFSHDKTPYKTHFSAHTGRKKPYDRGGFYLHFENGNCFIAGGFWGPEKDDLLRIRKAIDLSDELEKIISNPKFIKTFSELKGEELKTAPKGFPKDHQRIDLLRKKQFILTKQFTDSEILKANFPQKVVEVYKEMLPFYHYMTEILTTNENGESII